jgi:general secretion pathway protein L
MKLLTNIEQGLAAWTATVAHAIELTADRLLQRRQVSVRHDGTDALTFHLEKSDGKPALPDTRLRLVGGAAERPLPAEWLRAVQGCTMEIHLAPAQVLLRQLDFPKQAEAFLDGMIGTQIDRLTPWSADQTFFGFSPPQSAANDRIALTLAATPRAIVGPLVQLADSVGAATVSIQAEDGSAAGTSIQLFRAGLRSAIAGGRDVAKMLKFALLGLAAATAVVTVATMVLGSVTDAQLQDLQSSIARQRAALRPSAAASAPDTLLAKRKQTTPATVIVLEGLSKILPDGTYVTDMQVEGDRLQISGLTQDAPALIRLIEQSPQFSRATFFAPTTRAANEPGERFHIEAHINTWFGEGT